MQKNNLFIQSQLLKAHIDEIQKLLDTKLTISINFLTFEKLEQEEYLDTNHFRFFLTASSHMFL